MPATDTLTPFPTRLVAVVAAAFLAVIVAIVLVVSAQSNAHDQRKADVQAEFDQARDAARQCQLRPHYGC